MFDKNQNKRLAKILHSSRKLRFLRFLFKTTKLRYTREGQNGFVWIWRGCKKMRRKTYLNGNCNMRDCLKNVSQKIFWVQVSKLWTNIFMSVTSLMDDSCCFFRWTIWPHYMRWKWNTDPKLRSYHLSLNCWAHTSTQMSSTIMQEILRTNIHFIGNYLGKTRNREFCLMYHKLANE